MSMDRTADAGMESDLTEIRAALCRMPFPAQADDVLAALVRQRTPSRLLWRVGELPRTQSYHSLNDLCDDVARACNPAAPPPPGR